MSSVLPFIYKIGTTTQSPFPGAYILVGGAGANGMVPVYTSMPSFLDNGSAHSEFLNDKDAQVLVLPGYYLELYPQTLYGGTFTPYDNRAGTDVLYRNASLAASSCKLFYKFRSGTTNELPTNLINTVTLSISPSVTTSSVTYSSMTYRLYSFTSTTSTYTVSLTDTAGVGIDCLYLLIGGGGGGGSSSADPEVAGGGGGGAGAFVYGTLKVIPGATYNITVGAGGAGSQTTTGIGSPSSITRTVNSAVDATLSVGGGGSGGGPGATETLKGSYPSGIGGSSGGTWPAYGVGQAPRSIAANKYTLTGTSTLFTISVASANTGGTSSANKAGSGGGGAGGAGGDTNGSNNGPQGGTGAIWPVNGTTYAAGGGANNGKDSGNVNLGGWGGSSGLGGSGGSGTAGTANTGSGGGAKWNAPAGAGGSGICIIAVPLYRLAA